MPLQQSSKCQNLNLYLARPLQPGAFQASSDSSPVSEWLRTSVPVRLLHSGRWCCSQLHCSRLAGVTLTFPLWQIRSPTYDVVAHQNSLTTCLSFAAQTSDGRSDGKSKKVSDEYAAKLNSMQTELKKLQAAKREHTKLLRNQTHYETQLRTLRNDLASLKQLKVSTVICNCSLIGC